MIALITKLKLLVAGLVMLVSSAVGAVLPAPILPIVSSQLALINQVTYNPSVNHIGDVVGVFDGEHQFSENEKHSFTIVRINGLTRQQAEAQFSTLTGTTTKYRINYLASSTQIDATQLLPNVKLNLK